MASGNTELRSAVSLSQERSTGCSWSTRGRGCSSSCSFHCPPPPNVPPHTGKRERREGGEGGEGEGEKERGGEGESEREGERVEKSRGESEQEKERVRAEERERERVRERERENKSTEGTEVHLLLTLWKTIAYYLIKILRGVT